MARSVFGGGSADFLASIGPGGTLRAVPGTLTVWSAPVAGIQYTDLQINGDPASSVPVGSSGQVPQFAGPDGVTVVWADGGGGSRVRLLSDPAVLVAQAVEDWTPGTDLGLAERTTNFEPTTNADITGLSITLTGKGRPIDVRFNCTQAYHSAATGTSPVLMRADIKQNGVAILSRMGMRYNAAFGDGIEITARTETLTSGVSYTFTVGTWRGTVGTAYWYAAPAFKMQLAATAR